MCGKVVSGACFGEKLMPISVIIGITALIAIHATGTAKMIAIRAPGKPILIAKPLASF